jgi:predicted ATP-grasp superfamily ATP-dependent carboligase
VLLGLAQGLAGDPAFGAAGFRYCGSLYPWKADPRLLERMDALAQAATRAFGLVGANGIDFVLRDGEPYVLELNPRPSASMELFERAGRGSLFEGHAAACQGRLPSPPLLGEGEVLGKAVLWARRATVVGDTRSWLQREDVHDVPFPGERIRAGSPICTVFARGADAASAYRELAATAAAMERELREAVAPAPREHARVGGRR